MSSNEAAADKLREAILARPEVILEDRDVMRALVGANDRAMGDNVVDMRGLAMERLEARLDRLADVHRTVLAAAYENLAGMNQIHRAVLRLLEPRDFTAFLTDLGGEVAEILRVDSVRLVLESNLSGEAPRHAGLEEVLVVADAGFVGSYIARAQDNHRTVVLRKSTGDAEALFGNGAIASEALMPIDLGPGRLPALLAMGSEEPNKFAPGQATDLLAFFAAVFERALRRWLE
ncbi:DUF484 family protein [Ostreiculturibacter nitratireducens]|uniref:DUF484 family protein n=1 Tax=Ostreiculturibacter nitratireducens TaxID=3075226 RepID=UPI0031B5FE42